MIRPGVARRHIPTIGASALLLAVLSAPLITSAAAQSPGSPAGVHK